MGRQYVKMTVVENKGYKILDAGYRSVPDVNTAFDPEKIDRSHLVMAVRKLFKQQILTLKAKTLVTGIGGSLVLSK